MTIEEVMKELRRLKLERIRMSRWAPAIARFSAIHERANYQRRRGRQ